MKNNKLEDSLNKLFSNSEYKMVDVSDKNITHRKALATGEIVLGAEVIKLIKEKKMPKGDPLSIAEVSGINGVKKTSELIPLCHPLPLDHISLHTEVNDKKTYHVKFFRGRLLDPFGIDASKSQDMFAEYKKVAKNTFKFYVDYLKTRRKNNLTWAERSHIDV